MSFIRFFARSLVVMLVFVSSIHKFVANYSNASSLERDYGRLFNLFKSLSVNLPLEPVKVTHYSSATIYLAGAVGLIGSVLVLGGHKTGSYLLIVWLLSTMILHNPATADKEAVESSTLILLLHTGLIAGLVLAMPNAKKGTYN